MAAPLLAQFLGGGAESMLGNFMLAFVAAVAFATIVAVVAGLVLAAASAMSHDIWVGVIKGEHATDEGAARAARICSRHRRRAGDRHRHPRQGAERRASGRARFCRGRIGQLAGRAAHALLEALQYRRRRRRPVVGTLTAIGLVLVSPNVTYPMRRQGDAAEGDRDAGADARGSSRPTWRPPTGRRRRRSTRSDSTALRRRRRLRRPTSTIRKTSTCRRPGEAAVRSAQPGLISIPRLPRGDSRLAVLPRQASGRHVGRAICAAEHRDSRGKGSSSLAGNDYHGSGYPLNNVTRVRFWRLRAS